MNALAHRAIAPMGEREYDREQALDAARNAHIERRIPELKAEWRADLEVIADQSADVMYYRRGHISNHPNAFRIAQLIRDGNDDAELGLLLRTATLAAVDEAAEQRAEDESEDMA